MKVPNKTGSTDKKEVLLEDHDPIWLELWQAHIADVSLMICLFILVFPWLILCFVIFEANLDSVLHFCMINPLAG